MLLRPNSAALFGIKPAIKVMIEGGLPPITRGPQLFEAELAQWTFAEGLSRATAGTRDSTSSLGKDFCIIVV